MGEPDRETFGPLTDISAKSLTALACKVALEQRLISDPMTEGKLVARNAGSYNIAHIIKLGELVLVIRVPATGWGAGLTQDAARAMESQVATMRLIQTRTNIPIPEVYNVDTTDQNPIRAPYICMSFVSGRLVSKLWFEENNHRQQEQVRLRILTSLAKIVAQLSRLSFDTLGSIQPDSQSLGPIYDYVAPDHDEQPMQVVPSGPFPTLAALLDDAARKSDGNYGKGAWAKGEKQVMEVLRTCFLSAAAKTKQGFVLRPPDFNAHNIFADEDGNVTGIIDWDLTHTLPRFLGYVAYPSWITRDWDPLMYGWPKMKDSENSPDELERYRRHYDAQMRISLQDSADYELVRRSHMVEAIWIALLSDRNRLEIVMKFVREVLGEDVNAIWVLNDISEGTYSENSWAELVEGLQNLIT